MESNIYSGIKKEEISSLKFPDIEILDSFSDQMNRKNDIHRALILGNVFHSKVEIIFEDDQKKCKVNTTIWSVTENHLILKGNTYLPIERIREIIIV